MRSAAIVLAGGRSSRMGAPKAALGWHGSTLLRRVTGLLARAVDGPVVVVRAPGQTLPDLPAAVEVVVDAREGSGPLQGLQAGLTALLGRAGAAYVSSTDVPFLHPRFVERVLAGLTDDVDVALPEIGGHRQILAAAYRTDLLATVEELLRCGHRRAGLVAERSRVRILTADALLADTRLRRLDPELRSVSNLNDPAAYDRARAQPAPEIDVQRGRRRTTVAAWTLGDAAAAAAVTPDRRQRVSVNGDRIGWDPEFPLAAGDAVGFTVADAGG